MSEQTSGNEAANKGKAEDSGSKGGSDSTGSRDKDPKVESSTPENADGKLKPSSPGETGTTPGTNWTK